SYGTTPQDFIPFTSYETQDIVMCVDEKKFEEIMRQNVLGSPEIAYKKHTATDIIKEPNINTECLLNSVDSMPKLMDHEQICQNLNLSQK
ncbi:33299_t:CDS:1, partial [Racocetra persica]